MDIDIKSLYNNSFVISIDKYRLDKFYKTFTAMGWSKPLPEFVQGVKLDGRSTTIGCTKSHLKVVKIAKERNLPFCLIFEDDAYPCYGFISKMLQACKDLPENSNGLLLGYATESKLKTQENGLSISNVNNQSYIGSQAYIVMAKWYDKLIELLENNTIADHTFKYDTDLYFTDSILFIQHNNSSTLNSPRGGYMVKVCHKIDKYPPQGFPLIEDIITNTPILKNSDSCISKTGSVNTPIITTINFVFLDIYDIDETRLTYLIKKYVAIANNANNANNGDSDNNNNVINNNVKFTFVTQNKLDPSKISGIINKITSKYFNYSIVDNITDAFSLEYTYTCFIDSSYTIWNPDTYNLIVSSLLKYNCPSLLGYKQFVIPTGVARDHGYDYSYSGTLIKSNIIKDFLDEYPELKSVNHSILNIVMNLGLRTTVKDARHTYSNDAYTPGIIDLKYINADFESSRDVNKYIEDCKKGYTVIASILSSSVKSSKNLKNLKHDLVHVIQELQSTSS